MHDLAYFRANLDAIAERLTTRGFNLDAAEFRELDTQRRAALTEAENLQAERKKQSEEIGKLKKSGADTSAQQETVRGIGERITTLSAKAEELDEKFRDALARVPNVPHESVPSGKSADDNVE